MLLITSCSDANIVTAANQSSTIDVLKRFLIILTRLKTLSADALVTASTLKSNAQPKY
jgi:hypothetical protein